MGTLPAISGETSLTINPFKMPTNIEEIISGKQIKNKYRASTAASRLKSRQPLLDTHNLREVASQCSLYDSSDSEYSLPKLEKRDEKISAFLTDSKELMLLKHEIGTKRDEVLILEMEMEKEMDRLNRAESQLKTAASHFEEFLKYKEDLTMSAVTRASNEIKNTMSKEAEMERLTLHIQRLKCDITTQGDLLKNYLHYERFLQHAAEKSWDEELELSSLPALDKILQLPKAPEIPFEMPEQLLDCFHELIETNLFLLQHSEEVQENYEAICKSVENAQPEKDAAVISLKQQLVNSESAIIREKQAAEVAFMDTKIFDANIELQNVEAETRKLDENIWILYQLCVKDSLSSLSTMQMLCEIEVYIDDLISNIQEKPILLMEAVIADHEKEDKQIAMMQKEKHERIQGIRKKKLALQRAISPAKIKIDRPLVFRSQPPKLHVEMETADNPATEKNDFEYFIGAM